MLQRKAREKYQNLSEEQNNRKRQYAKDTQSFLQKMNLAKKKKTEKRQYVRNLYINLSKEKKRKGVNMQIKKCHYARKQCGNLFIKP